MAGKIARRDFLRLSATAAAGTVLAACASPAAAPTAAPTAAAPAKEGGGTLVFGYGQKISYQNLCAQKYFAGNSDVYNRRLLHAGLVQVSVDFSEYIPDLAEGWTFDGNTCTFHLRNNLQWHDGEPLTAEDVEFTFRVLGHPNSNTYTSPTQFDPYIAGWTEFREGNVDEVSGITAVDDHTIAFELTRPVREAFIASVATRVMLPKHILSQVPEENWVDDGLCKTDWALNTGIGAGPFKLVQYAIDEFVEMERNENYHRTLPLLDRVIFRSYVDGGQQLAAAIETGECHVGRIPPTEIERFQTMDHLDLVQRPGRASRGFGVNTNTVPKELRQALLYALDREALIDAFWPGATQVTSAFVEYKDYGISPDAVQYNYDPEKARQLVEASGWDTSQELRLLIPEQISPSDEAIFASVFSYWEDVGIKVRYDIKGADFDKYQREPEGTDMRWSAWAAFGLGPWDWRSYFLNDVSNPFPNYPEAIEIIDQIELSEDEDEIRKGFYRLQEIMHEEAYFCLISRVEGVYAMSKKIQGGFKPIYALWSRNDWEWDKIWVDENA